MIFKESFVKGVGKVAMGILVLAGIASVVGILGLAIMELWMVSPEVVIAVVVLVGIIVVGGGVYAVVKDVKFRRRMKGRTSVEQLEALGLPRTEDRIGVPTGFAPAGRRGSQR